MDYNEILKKYRLYYALLTDQTSSDGVDEFPVLPCYLDVIPNYLCLLNPRGKYKTKTATYKQIKEYIKEKYGLNAHTSYIAEIKRKHGIQMINVRSN